MLQGKSVDVLKITKKYGTTAFMYTQYPHKRFWHRADSDEKFKQAIINRFSGSNHPTILYVHMPYCEQLCWFCTCHISITKNYDKVNHYMKFIHKEIEWLTKTCVDNIRPDFKEVHLGGGSPTFIDEVDFDHMLACFGRILDVSKLDEFAIEIDPRRVNQDRMLFYADRGISRISFGVQDFDLEVQKAINRVQPAYLIENLITPDIRHRFRNGINFDILVGLPHQTPETMEQTCRQIIDLSPDRVCMNYMHYSPEFAKHQSIMMDGKSGRPDRLPDFVERKEIFLSALETLTSGGYVRTGYDHFAKPDDANAKALLEGKMGWNDLGATPGRVFDCIGLGVSSRSTIGDAYFENFYEIVDYENSLDQDLFPIYRQHELSCDEIIRREVILSLRNYFKVFYHEINDKYNIKFVDYFADEILKLHEFESDHVVDLFEDKIVITESGCQFANLVCRVFDKYYDSNHLVEDLGERVSQLVPLNISMEKLSHETK